MKETDFYDVLVEKLHRELINRLGKGWSVAAVSNKTDAYLPGMLKALEAKIGSKIFDENVHHPGIKPDILVAARGADGQSTLILVEVKYADQLGLMDFSQLAGYLLVSKIASVGLLLLVSKPDATDLLSGDFREVVTLGELNSAWTVSDGSGHLYGSFQQGILSYRPGGGFDWERSWRGSITSFDSLVEFIQSRPV